ncbi:hypothetical protein [Shewanella baltica]|uniref:hypothetical protein n=1 Tax=Shewanella baltica TaxID=62322 RepID=UPI00325E20BF
MSINRARVKQKAKWNYEQFGCFGQYSCSDSLPIEFITTTLQIDELANLTYAKNIRTELDFELLIQRDIDEKRAIEQISKYISPENGTGYGTVKNNGVFLPPLVVAVVNTIEGKVLSDAYPDLISNREVDNYGVKFTFEWEDLFKVTMFEQSKGMPYRINDEEIEIDSKNVHVEFYLGKDNEKGGRLVVIDGQHRLFALNYLRHHHEHKDKIKNLIIPVCILYSPTSTVSNVQDNAPKIPDVLRKLFIDVNNNAKTVSGHFKILLSDDDVGKLTCSSFCSSLLEDDFYDGKALSLIEWNTKTDKESKTISKPYTLTSIGVIYDVLADLFKTKSGKQVLEYILNIDEITEKLDFGQDGDGESRPYSADFPWRDIPYNNKPLLKGQVNKYLTPCIMSIFFETDFYKKFVDQYFDTRKNKLETLISTRSKQSQIAEALLEHLDQFTDIEDKHVQRMLSDFISEFTDNTKLCSPEIVRTNVFQKAVITAWFNFLSYFSKYELIPLDVTKIFISVLEKSVSSSLFINSLQNLYLQDCIYDGLKILPTKESRNQIARLILSKLGSGDFSKIISLKMKDINNDLNEDLIFEELQSLGGTNASQFVKSLHNTQIKAFTKNYKSNTDLSAIEIQELIKLEENRSRSIKAKRNDKSIEVDDSFIDKVKFYINIDFKLAIDQLSVLLGYISVFDEFIGDDTSEDQS